MRPGARTRWAVLAAGLLGACGASPVPGTPKDTADSASPTGPTDSATGPAHTWAVSGFQGNLVSVYRQFTPGHPRGFDLYAAFAEDLPAFDDPAWCLAGGPCVETRPTGDARATLPAALPTEGVRWSWVGNELEVDRYDLIFRQDPRREVSWYTTSGGGGKPDGNRLTVEFSAEGEWGGWEDKVLPQSPGVEVLRPAPGQRVNLEGDTLEFAWVPGDEGDVYLSILGQVDEKTPIHEVYGLEDDGSFTLDLRAHGLNAESDVLLSLGRRITAEAEVNGNRLALTAIDEQPFSPECLPYPEVDIPPRGPSGSEINPFYLGINFDVLLDSSQAYDFTREGEASPTSATMTFQFFDAVFQPLCEIVYDISGPRSEPVAPWLGAYESFEVQLRDGRSDCGQVDRLTFGTPDLRRWLELNFTWGWGYGQTVQVVGTMSYSGYVTFDGVNAFELNRLRAYELYDCDQAITSNGFIPFQSTGALRQNAYMTTETYFVLALQ